jgi:spermidine synthase
MNNKYVAPFIYEEVNSKSLHFTINQLQSKMSKASPNVLKVEYTKTMMGFLLLNRRPNHIVMIGLGGGSLAKFCYQHLPESKITVVEINPHVIALRKEFLIPDDNDRFEVVLADGADYICEFEGAIDVLLVDGFDHQGQPPQLSSKRFYSDCRAALTQQGVLAINFHEYHPLYETFIDRVDTAFESNLVEVATNDAGNVIVFAAKGIEIAPSAFRSKMNDFYSEVSQWNTSNA